MSAPAASSASFMRLLRRFRRNRKAAAAVEFALVAPVFLALLFAILETALMFFASQVLESVTQQSARMVLTGQAQNSGWDKTAFQTYVCNQLPALFSCAKIAVDVKYYTSFSAVSFSLPVDNTGNLVSANLQYNPGGPGCTVVVQVYYPWQLFVTGLGYNIANYPNNQRLLIGTAAFKNEPFPGNASAPASCN
ncbi:MAG TPA: TadE/TadG family type IV pilus assembly protein [Bradyrhizobium sp.]|jgi:Flp pilus assembly protein TadG